MHLSPFRLHYRVKTDRQTDKDRYREAETGTERQRLRSEDSDRHRDI